MNKLFVATTVGALLAGTGFASAACPNGQYESYTATGAGTSVDPFVAVQHCSQTANDWITGHFYGNPVVDPADPTKQLVVDGHPISSTSYSYPFGMVYGQSGVAGGDGASVGSASCSSGWTMDGGMQSCSPTSATASLHYHHAEDGAPASCDAGWSLSNGTCAPSQTTASAAYTQKSVNNGSAVGAGSSVQHDNSTALGAGAKSTTDHQVVLGSKDETVTAPGIASQQSKDRQSGATEVVTTDANGNLASDGGRIDQTLTNHGGRIGSLEGRADRTDGTLVNHGAAISDLYGITHGQALAISGLYDITNAHTAQISALQHDMKTVQGGVALALALDVPHLETGKRFGVAVNMADFDGTGAFAGGVAFRIDANWQVNAGGGFGFNGGANGGKVGVVGQW